MDYGILLSTAKTILNKEENKIEHKLQELCDLLQQSVEHYDWVGFYFANQEEKTLHLGPYAGLPTDHTVIPFGKGICGQVAVSNNTFLVDDVTAQDNYISCNINVKAEIVVPLFVSGQNVGQIDIDSNTLNAFTSEDRLFLEKMNEEIARLF
ncbi:GAF domain-containing protein [Myroides indicus]|uniref:GAF domain-containing protein n=1 Tax=Myroides indicus TaxID=1323422 RepID=A0A4R7ENY9_9FLAO|nr:GAF domain-containing protein [Myroides indicus]TDS52729.1 GAF domain-containing protein [Myroides indicus]